MNQKLVFAALGFSTGVLAMGGYHFKVLMAWKRLNDKHHLLAQESIRETIKIFEEELAKGGMTEEHSQYLKASISQMENLLD